MPKSLEAPTLNKIKSFQEISEILGREKKKIIQCHGVFDLLHPGHIRHFREAKAQGDCLVVTVTPDRILRPLFQDVESLSPFDPT